MDQLTACSTLGASVTHAQARLVLSVTTGPVVIALDADPAGRQGTLQWVAAACVDAGRLVHIAHLPDGLDPADWLARHDTNGLSALDPAQRHTGSIGVDDVTPPTLPGRELARLACTTTGPVTTAFRFIGDLRGQLSCEQEQALVRGVTDEMTRQSWNPDNAFTRDLQPRASRDRVGPARPPARRVELL